jgi:sporadic carbohydrate cluster 2OG-Fe(II) oxygenase
MRELNVDMNAIREIESRGYALVPADNTEVLEGIRQRIHAEACRILSVPQQGSPEDFFNRFHERKVSGAELNRVRLGIVNFATQELQAGGLILEAFRSSLVGLIGPDIAGQKTVNLVIQQPGDADQVPTHRDAPANSHFEVVVWVPLVPVYGTKSMIIADRENTMHGLSLLQSGKGFAEFEKFIDKNSVDLEVPFGSACFFAAGLAHGCRVNREKETRWSLNVRFKNAFSPYGAKSIPDFFKILELSPLSKIAMDFEKQEYDR